MAVDVRQIQWVLTAQDQATGVLRGVQGAMGHIQTTWIALASALASGAVLTSFLSNAIAVRSALDDLADTTGDNVTTLDGLRLQAAVSGTSMDQLGGALTKLSRNLNSADDDGKSAGEAIKSIGLNIEELRAKKPGEALIDIALALGKFEDGAAKVAVATALMGREGAKMLPYLKDIAEAGGVNGRITAEQAAQAEKLEKEWRKLNQVWKEGSEHLASAAIPGLISLVEWLNEGARSFGSITKAAEVFGTQMLKFTPMGWFFRLRENEYGGLTQPGAPALPGVAPGGALDMGIGGTGWMKDRLNFRLPSKEGGTGRASGLDEEAKLLEAGRRGWIAYADAVFAAADAENKAVSAGESFTQWAEKNRDRVLDNIDETRAWNREMEDLIKLLNTGYLSLAQFNQAAMSPQLRRLINPGKSDMDVLNEALKEGDIGLDQYIEAAKRINGEFKGMKDTANDIGMIFSSAASDAFRDWQGVGNLIRAIGIDIAQMIFRKGVSEPIGNLFSGAISSFDWSKLFTSVGGAARGGSFGAGDMTWVGEEGPELVRFRSPATVIPHGQSMQMGGGDTYYIDARGADSAKIAHLEALIRTLNGSVEHRAVAAVANASQRGGSFRHAMA